MNIQKNRSTDDVDLKAELLDAQTLREGILLLGCVTHIKSTFVVLSLPGCLSGIVPVSNISGAFTESVNRFSINNDIEEPKLDAIFEAGMIFPCKVMQVSHDTSKRKPYITLSIDPKDVNTNLRPSCLYSKMVVFVSICSLEDHGYVVDLGSKNIQGFLLYNSEDQIKKLKVGQVIPTSIQKITTTSKVHANVLLSKLDFNEDFPKVSAKNMKLTSILPGAKISADVIEINHPFVYMKYFNFDACASLLSVTLTKEGICVGSAVEGTVLYVHPVTRMIHIMLHSKPTPNHFLKCFGLQKYELVKNIKFQCLYKNRAYFKAKNTFGFISTRDLPKIKHNLNAASVCQSLTKASVLSLYYMDNLVQMTAKPSIIDKEIVLPHEVQIGNIYEAVVKEHKDDGMLVCICPGLYGFVRRIFMSDVFLTKPETLFPINSKVKCRVLSTDGNGKITLTSKESLLNVPERGILSSLENIQKGQLVKGVIAQKTDSYILLLFFNNIKGIVPSFHIPASSIFFVGQTVLCKVLDCNPSQQKLKLSMKIEDVINNLDDEILLNKTSSHSMQSKVSSKKRNQENNQMASKSEKKKKVCTSDKDDPNNPVLQVNEKAVLKKHNAHKPVKAIIKKVTGHHLNILLNEGKGRVHITELGCMSEGMYPLKVYSAKQEIQVYVIGEYKRRKCNYLDITHRNFAYFKECTLQFPPPIPLTRDFSPGDSVIGFVKEVHHVSVLLWLSPSVVGMLDYLHFSDNVKVVRKLHKRLKIGVSLNVSILHNKGNVENEMGRSNVTLTKLELDKPEAGKNILGLVQIASIEKGLVLKLPFGYHGAVALADLTDVYSPLPALLEKYRKLRFVLCHVLEVNHETKFCLLSLRQSRLFKKSISNMCPEITVKSIKQGDYIKGYVKRILNTAIIVEFGRQLEGKIHLHRCLRDCKSCHITKDISMKYCAGSVTDIIIEEISADGKTIVLALPELKNKEQKVSDRLSITEDITWDEII